MRMLVLVSFLAATLCTLGCGGDENGSGGSGGVGEGFISCETDEDCPPAECADGGCFDDVQGRVCIYLGYEEEARVPCMNGTGVCTELGCVVGVPTRRERPT